jgi:hypothetical protein
LLLRNINKFFAEVACESRANRNRKIPAASPKLLSFRLSATRSFRSVSNARLFACAYCTFTPDDTADRNFYADFEKCAQKHEAV